MEPFAPLCKRPKPSAGVDATADGSRFSDLPDKVVHHIFSFLETMDVIRASAVSKKWRYLRTSMPHLSLKYEGPVIRAFSEYSRFKDVVNWVLMSHDKSVSIKSCRLSCFNTDNDHSVYRWLYVVAQQHVQELFLNLSSDSENPFLLPRCLLASDSLEVLKLNLHDVLNIPSNAGFSRLKSLRLVNTQLLNQTLFQNFIPSCPLLEILSLEGCELHGFRVLDISSRNLKKLVIKPTRWAFHTLDLLKECDLKISCPNLVYFDLTYTLVQSLSWGEIPSFLQTAIIFTRCCYSPVLTDEFANSLLKILREVGNAEVLKLHKDILKCISPAVAKSGCFSTIFHNLKTLKLSTGMEVCYIQSIIYMLKCAPNLQLLSLCIVGDKHERDYKWTTLDEGIVCLTCHLKMVKLIDIDNVDDKLQLIGFFLKNGHVLEKMSIIWHRGVDWETQREAIQKVMMFPRLSSHVNITFSEPKRFGEFEL